MWNIEIEVDIGTRQVVIFEFKREDPVQEVHPFFRIIDLCTLERDIGIDITVHDHHISLFHPLTDKIRSICPVTCKQESHQIGIHLLI